MENETVELETLADTGNIAETLAREFKGPIELESIDELVSRTALPPGWNLAEKDNIALAAAPRRKVAAVALNDADSLSTYINRHKIADTTLWCEADYRRGNVNFTAIINDHGSDPLSPAWRDHVATYTPPKSEEWHRWFESNGKAMKQVEFAVFIEDNMRDIAGADGMPSASEMLEMALQFEANQDMRFKSAVRLTNGGVQMNFVQDDDTATLQKMKLFERFRIGIPVFWNGDAYAIDARLRYRVRDGAVTFWYELIRPDKVLEDATRTLITKITDATEVPFFFGKAK